jgi:lipopolysaccharide assembly protein A
MEEYMRIFSYVILLLLMLLGITFAALNSTPVVFNYYLGTKHIALSLLLVFALGVGIIIGIIFTLFSVLKLKHENRRLRAKIKVAEKEVENLRSIPIKGE